jgi:hypothetical protein
MRSVVIVNVIIKKMPGHWSRHYHQNKCAINHYFKMIQIFCIGIFMFSSFIVAKVYIYNKILLTITTKDASKMRRIMFFMI